jgi:hypothetical protein
VRRALHESAHALVALARGRHIYSVSIVGTSAWGGVLHFEPDPEDIKGEAMIAVAGSICEEELAVDEPVEEVSPLLAPERESPFFTPAETELLIASDRLGSVPTDDEAALDFARQLDPDDPEQALERIIFETRLLILGPLRGPIIALADALARRGSLDGAQVRATLKGAAGMADDYPFTQADLERMGVLEKRTADDLSNIELVQEFDRAQMREEYQSLTGWINEPAVPAWLRDGADWSDRPSGSDVSPEGRARFLGYLESRSRR